MTRVLYVAYWGAGEPLGQSLVLPAVERLSRAGLDLTLLTYDKPADHADRARMAEVAARLRGARVRWISLRYHKRPRMPATAFDIAYGWWRGVIDGWRHGRPHVVHARTFIGGIVGLLIAMTVGARLVYHNEGFYPDEQVDGGFWAAGSRLHRITLWIERRLYRRSDGLIVLSHRAAETLRGRPEAGTPPKPIVVVPSCTDLDRFPLLPPSPPAHVTSFVYTGAVGGRYELDRVGAFLAVAERVMGPLHLRVLTRAEPRLVTDLLDRGGLGRQAWSMTSVPHADMAAELARHHAGLFFLARGTSEHGCSPTKIGEYWACGLPVVTTPGVSDTDDVIARHRVGVIVADHSPAAYETAARELSALLADGDLRRRCRAAAEEHYALAPAVERQVQLYRALETPA